jgi:hypothetical protein
MTRTFGVFSESDGGFLSEGGTFDEATTLYQQFISEDPESEDDLRVVPECGEHEGQPESGCSACESEQKEEEEA